MAYSNSESINPAGAVFEEDSPGAVLAAGCRLVVYLPKGHRPDGRPMLLRRVVVCAVVLLLLTRVTVADVVVLRNQKRHAGTIANREILAGNPGASKFVSILVASTTADTVGLLRISVGDIEYVILEDGEKQRVIDFTSLPPGIDDAATPAAVPGTAGSNVMVNPTPISRGGAAVLPVDSTRRESSKVFSSVWARDGRGARTRNTAIDVGVPLIVIGFVAFVVGVAVKFGGPKFTISGTSAKVEENSYNAANYALMVGGGISTVAGIVVVSQPRSPTGRAEGPSPVLVGLSTRF